MGAAEPASFDTVGETIRTNHYQSSSFENGTNRTKIYVESMS
jgi:hypothetical protein